MNIGVRGHDFSTTCIEDLSKALKHNNICNIQLALLKSLKNMDLKTGMFSPGLARYIKNELDKNDIHVSVLGCYINPVHHDDEKCEQHLDLFKGHILYAKYLGADIIATETGSVNGDNKSEESYQRLLKNMRALAEYASNLGVIIAVEPVSVYTLYSPEITKRFLDDINMSNVGIVLDPVNLLDVSNYKHQNEIVKKCFDLFGDRIFVIHLKDYIIEGNKLITKPATYGMFDFQFLFNIIKDKKPNISMILEEVDEGNCKEIINKLSEMF